MTATCGNPHEPCAKVGVRYFGRLKLCIACHRRFTRHGDGKRYDPWQISKERKLQMGEGARNGTPDDHYEIMEQWQERDSDGVMHTYAKTRRASGVQAFNEKRRTR